MDLGGHLDGNFDNLGGFYGGYGHQSGLEGLWDGTLAEMPAAPGLPAMGDWSVGEEVGDFGLPRADVNGSLFHGFQ